MKNTTKKIWSSLQGTDRHITFEPTPKIVKDESFEAVVILDCLRSLTEEEKEVIENMSYLEAA